ncbi:MAG: hypothetical protein WCD49_15870 [Candidatus Acidiferrales bacterium]
MSGTLEETLLSVWQQAMVENLADVVTDGRTWPVKQTARRRLRQVDFQFDGRDIRGLEQNPDTKSLWAQQARAGKKVMQFLADTGRYIAVVADGRVHLYGKSKQPPL